MLARLATVVDEATAAFEVYDYTQALEHAEAFFWSFCDDYLELVKTRSYGRADELDDAPAMQSARGALAAALWVQLRLLAPFLPYVTEEAWSWWQDGSVHRSTWPTSDQLVPTVRADQDGSLLRAVTDVLAVTSEVLGAVRRAKTAAKRSMRSRVARLEVVDRPERLVALRAARDDLVDAGGVDELVLREGEPGIAVTLAES